MNLMGLYLLQETSGNIFNIKNEIYTKFAFRKWYNMAYASYIKFCQFCNLEIHETSHIGNHIKKKVNNITNAKQELCS